MGVTGTGGQEFAGQIEGQWSVGPRARHGAASRVALLVTVTDDIVTLEIRYDRMPRGGAHDIDRTVEGADAHADTARIWQAPIPHELRA